MSKKETEVRKHYYAELLSGIIAVLEQGRQSAARSVNAVLTATYGWSGSALSSMSSTVPRGQRTVLSC